MQLARASPRHITRPASRRSLEAASPPSEQNHDQLERDQDDDRDLERLAARDPDALERRRVAEFEDVELPLDALLPRAEAQALGGSRVELRQVHVAADLEGVVEALDH